MKNLLLVLGLLAVVLFPACQSNSSKADHGDACKVCAANDAVKAAVPNAKAVPCAACMQHEMMAACPKCVEMGKPCCEKCAAKMECPQCKVAGGECATCKIAHADCVTCAVKKATWTSMACPSCANSATPCTKCSELKTKLSTVKCTDCAMKG